MKRNNYSRETLHEHLNFEWVSLSYYYQLLVWFSPQTLFNPWS